MVQAVRRTKPIQIQSFRFSILRKFISTQYSIVPREVLIDFKVVNSDAASYVGRPVRSVLESAAAAKKAKHRQACADRRADFTPFVCTTDGAIHREGLHFLRRLSARLSLKWELSYSRGWAMNFVRTRMSLAILRASVHCLRGARRKFFSLTADSAAAMALF